MTNTVLSKQTDISTLAGVNVAGYLTSESGVGEAARGYIKALQYLNLDVALNNFEVGVQSRKEDKTFTTFASNNPFPVNIVCVNADQLTAFRQKQGDSYFADKYNIGVWWWETPQFPEEWLENFNFFDEIWVGSAFIQKAIANISPVPVVLVPPVVEPKDTQSNRTRFHLSENEFVFLCIFDFLSSFERKNPLATVAAFKQAFSLNEPVRLILKCINADKNSELLSQIESEIGDHKITILNQYLSSEDNQALINSCDAYVSLHRAEGLGLPIAEAMLNKKPVVTTGWSGNMDFTSVANSYLVSYELIANQVQVGPYKIADTWAAADTQHAAQQMKSLWLDVGAREKIAAKAYQTTLDYFSRETIAQIIQTRFSSIAAFNRPREDSPREHGPREHSKEFTQVCHVDSLTEQRLRIIETGENPAETNANKSRIRKTMMSLVEKSGYFNHIYSSLFRKLFVDTSKIQTQVELVDSRTRSSLAAADRRIAALEKKLTELQSKDK